MMSEEPKPVPSLTREQLLEKALRLLARRDYSVAGLQARLRRHSTDGADVDWVLERLRSVKFLDDQAVADRKAARAREQLLGQRRVEQELRALQVGESTIADSVAAHYSLMDEDSLALRHMEQKLNPLLAAGSLEEPKGLQRAYGRLRRAGFGHGATVRALRHHSKLAGDMDDTAPDEDFEA